MRKFLIIFVVASMLVVPLTAMAEQEETGLNIEAKSAILVDSQSDTVMFEKDADQKMPIASITKVMTLNLVFEAVENGALSLEEKITVSESAAGMGGSQAFIDAGFAYSAEDLIKGVIVASANDCAVALAERLAGSEEAFVAKMNKKAQELGMTNTSFKNCTGLPAKEQYSTSRDVTKMSIELLKHQDYFKWSNIWMDELKHEKDGRVTQLVNTNKLIRSLNGCDGLKTGSTDEAGFCITTTAKRDEMRLIAVVLGGSTSKTRFNDASKLINYGFANYEYKLVVSPMEKMDFEIPVKSGVVKGIIPNAKTGFYACTKISGEDVIETRYEVPEFVEAPIEIGQTVGRIIVLKNGTEIGSVELVNEEFCKKAGFLDKLKGIFSFWK